MRLQGTLYRESTLILLVRENSDVRKELTVRVASLNERIKRISSHVQRMLWNIPGSTGIQNIWKKICK